MTQSENNYELFSLQKAVHYQKWIIDKIRPYLGKRILELGAGIGNMSRWLVSAERLILTEYDADLIKILNSLQSSRQNVLVQQFDLSTQSLNHFQKENIDTIVSFNVLEHIKEDEKVLSDCLALLENSTSKEKKRIISFVPAHQWAYGHHDLKVKHYRRYNKKQFRHLHQLLAPQAKLVLIPFNFIGLWGWFVNGRIMRRTEAGQFTIDLFEKICPFLKYVDFFIIEKCKIPLGQSLIAIIEL